MNFLEEERKISEANGTLGIFFVTLGLRGSLTDDVVLMLQNELDREIIKIRYEENSECRIRRLKKVYFTKIDAALDAAAYGPQWLRKYDLAKLIINSLQELNGEVINLICYTVMPNHVHLVFQVRNNAANQSAALHHIDEFKQKTALRASEMLMLEDDFWIRDDHVHAVADQKELINIISYILENPVKAGLVDYWRDWPWSYCNADFI